MKKAAKAVGHTHDHDHCVEDALAAAERLCAAKDLRFTPLRRRVLELVWSSHKPVGAYALLDSLRNEDLGSAPPTVYRALDFLIENGLAHRIESKNAFIGCSHRHSSDDLVVFLICERCGEVGEAPSQAVAESLKDATRAAGFAPKTPVIEITGICANCR